MTDGGVYMGNSEVKTTFSELASALANDYESIYLHTHKTLPGAIEFWKKMGFIIFLDENDELETVHMDKIIHELNMAYHDSEFNYAVEF